MNLAKIIFLCYFYVDTQILCHIFSDGNEKLY